MASSNASLNSCKTGTERCFDAIKKAKPSGAKGIYMKKVTISSTMGPGVKIDYDK